MRAATPDGGMWDVSGRSGAGREGRTGGMAGPESVRMTRRWRLTGRRRRHGPDGGRVPADDGRAPVPQGHRRRRCRCASRPRRVATDVRRYRALCAGDGGAFAVAQGRIDGARVRASTARRPERQPGSGT